MNLAKIKQAGVIVGAGAIAWTLSAAIAWAACVPGGTSAAPGSPTAKVQEMVEQPTTEADGSRHAAGGPAKPRERWMTPCPQGQEPDKSGACRTADLPPEKPSQAGQNVASADVAQTSGRSSPGSASTPSAAVCQD